MAAAGAADINVDPLRLEAISLQAFGAFSANERIPIGGRNLVIYGENGAGKSSIYRALRDLFARVPSSQSLAKAKHVHDLDDDLVPAVTVEFSKGAAVEWTLAKHPGLPMADPRIAQARTRSAFLDYQALLKTNALHGDAPPNLFKLSVDMLLADFADTANGKTIDERWRAVEAAKPRRHKASGSHLPPVEAACAEFNAALDAAVTVLTPKVNELLVDLGHSELVIKQFSRESVRYVNATLKRDRVFAGQELLPVLEFRKHEPPAPQLFLNEARLSALALAIYFAGRLCCIPSAPSPALKLLVLDDVLVGLDYANRRPLLTMLEKHFSDWQVVLLTHDRHWFEIIRAAIPAEKWTCHELYEMVAVSGQATPFLRPVAQSVVIATLDQADGFVAQKHLPAAANYARSACEMFFRKYCEDHPALKFSYKSDPKKGINFEKLRTTIASSVADDPAKKAALKKLEPFQQRILNPLSHDPATSLNEAEVVAAIKAVREMIAAL
jgi:hypothetical protein